MFRETINVLRETIYTLALISLTLFLFCLCNYMALNRRMNTLEITVLMFWGDKKVTIKLFS